jgi:hypothetical protein
MEVVPKAWGDHQFDCIANLSTQIHNENDLKVFWRCISGLLGTQSSVSKKIISKSIKKNNQTKKDLKVSLNVGEINIDPNVAVILQ